MHKFNVKNRLKYASVHLFISFIFLCIALYLVFMVWYPSPLHIAVGVGSVYLILLLVDLTLGPLLTFIVYKSDRKKLIFDVTIIVVIQLSAYIFGLYTMAQGRPVWKVFVIDDIELVSPVDIKKTADYMMKEEFESSIFSKPQWVAAVYSDEPNKKQQQMEDEMFAGINISQRPEAYKQLISKKQAILTKLRPLDDLRKFNLNQAKLTNQLAKYPEARGWLPVKAPDQDMVALFDHEAQPLGIVDLAPWK